VLSGGSRQQEVLWQGRRSTPPVLYMNENMTLRLLRRFLCRLHRMHLSGRKTVIWSGTEVVGTSRSPQIPSALETV
jgi:hypothetical protein